MADVTIVSADVRPLPGCLIRRFVAGGAIDVGSPVYLSAADTVSAANGAAVATSFAIGVLVAVYNGASSTAAASGEYVDIVMEGPVAGYSTNMAQNALFFCKASAGVVATTAATKSTIIGIGLSASVLYVHPIWVSLS